MIIPAGTYLSFWSKSSLRRHAKLGKRSRNALCSKLSDGKALRPKLKSSLKDVSCRRKLIICEQWCVIIHFKFHITTTSSRYLIIFSAPTLIMKGTRTPQSTYNYQFVSLASNVFLSNTLINKKKKRRGKPFYLRLERNYIMINNQIANI